MAKKNTTTNNTTTNTSMDVETMYRELTTDADGNPVAHLVNDNTTHVPDIFAPPGGNPIVGVEPDFRMAFDGFSVTAGDLPLTSLRYLLQYGFAQSLQDMSAAQIRAQAERKGVEITDEEVSEALHARRADKVKNLLTGQIFAKRISAPRADNFTKTIKVIVLERLQAACVKAGKKLPAQNTDAYGGLFSQYMAKFGDDVRTEAQRRLDMALETTIDLDDLLEAI